MRPHAERGDEDVDIRAESLPLPGSGSRWPSNKIDFLYMPPER